MNSILKKICPTWLTTPWRRLVQTLCFVLFLILFFYYCWPYRFDYNNENIQLTQLELFLTLDPLVSISTAIASKTIVWSLSIAVIVLLVCIFFPRWFCGYVCPMGTLIDLFDWGIGKNIKHLRLKKSGWWINLRFYFLIGILVAALSGVLLSGFVAAIPVLTRGMLYILGPLQLGLLKNFQFVPQINSAQYVSILLFTLIPLLGLLRSRFWCAYVCPSGALLSLASFFRLTDRRVDNTCTACSLCLSECSFDCITSDFSARYLACATCFSCKNICPQKSIKFTPRWSNSNLNPLNQISCNKSITRRKFLIGTLAACSASVATAAGLTFERDLYTQSYPVRPPGSVPETTFLKQCIRCGLCIKVCPESTLQPSGFERGIDGIWTPAVTADFSGCKPLCNNCGQVCPTGAIRDLILEEKKAARIGIATVDKNSCLPYYEKESCGLCYEACSASGYNAIEYNRIGFEYDNNGMLSSGSGILAPVVIEEKCIGCGLCQEKCYSVMVKEKKILTQSAIKIYAGPGKEDRITSGSYLSLQEGRKKIAEKNKIKAPQNEYLPDFLR
ncbi:4Fe-4S dicluster domain-containing protein [Thermodesulfobacteriota bacterium]